MHTFNIEAGNQPQPLASVGRLLSKKELVELIGVSSASIDRWAIDSGNCFPVGIKIGPNRVAWTETSIVDWLQSLSRQGGQS